MKTLNLSKRKKEYIGVFLILEILFFIMCAVPVIFGEAFIFTFWFYSNFLFIFPTLLIMSISDWAFKKEKTTW